MVEEEIVSTYNKSKHIEYIVTVAFCTYICNLYMSVVSTCFFEIKGQRQFKMTD